MSGLVHAVRIGWRNRTANGTSRTTDQRTVQNAFTRYSSNRTANNGTGRCAIRSRWTASRKRSGNSQNAQKLDFARHNVSPVSVAQKGIFVTFLTLQRKESLRLPVLR
jgi:hypothetical protein